MTDEETKKLLIAYAETLRETTETAFRAHEMAWRMFGALGEAVPGFLDHFRSQTAVSTQQIVNSRIASLEQLDAILQRLKE